MPVQPRAVGHVELKVKSVSSATVLADLRQAGSLKCLFPRRSGPGLESVLVNTAGGVTGGDSFSCRADAGTGCTLTVTTQAAERAYRATAQDVGTIRNELTAQPGSRLNWLPQETILFDACALRRTTHIDLNGDAQLLYCEPVVFGRLAMGESVRTGQFYDRVEIRRDGRLLYLDAIRLDADIQAQLDRPFVANGARAMVCVVYAAHDAETHLEPLREMLPDTAGATLLEPDLLVMRLLAEDGFVLRQTLIPVLNRLHRSDLPRCWMI